MGKNGEGVTKKAIKYEQKRRKCAKEREKVWEKLRKCAKKKYEAYGESVLKNERKYGKN